MLCSIMCNWIIEPSVSTDREICLWFSLRIANGGWLRKWGGSVEKSGFNKRGIILSSFRAGIL